MGQVIDGGEDEMEFGCRLAKERAVGFDRRERDERDQDYSYEKCTPVSFETYVYFR